MDFFFLDKVTWQHSQTLYHAAAHLGREAIFILRPASPYVCIGYHQDAEQEIDLEFAARHKIPVFRREVGGGAVYLDSNQLFYQFILDPERHELPANKGELYRFMLAPVVETYRAFGVDAEYKPVNDIIANNRKVSGNGAAEINDMLVVVGNFLLDFNYDMMSKVLRVPDEKFRDKVYKTLQDNLSTFVRETGTKPDTWKLAEDFMARCEAIFGPLELKTEADAALLSKADRLFEKMYTDEWLFENDRLRPKISKVKIREGVSVIQNVTKTPGGLIRVTAVNEDGYLHNVHISGDFFFYPSTLLTDLEQELEGVRADAVYVNKVIEDFYTENQVETPGIKPSGFASVLLQNI